MDWLTFPEEDRPPEEIWLDNDGLVAHFERVNERRKSKAEGKNDDWESVPDLEQNELTRGLR